MTELWRKSSFFVKNQKLDKYSYFSERAATQHAIFQYIDEHTEEIINLFLSGGIDAISTKCSLFYKWQKQLAFDHLVFDKNLIKALIRSNSNFYLSMIVDGHAFMIRKILGLSAKKYERVWFDSVSELHSLFNQKMIDEKYFNNQCMRFFMFFHKR